MVFDSQAVANNNTPLKNALSSSKGNYDHWIISEVCTLKEIRLCLKETRLMIQMEIQSKLYKFSNIRQIV